MPFLSRFFCLALSLLTLQILGSNAVYGQVELLRLNEQNFAQAPGGKEADWIFGDFVLRNEQITAVIANPVKGRNANMTVKGVGGGIIDLTRREVNNDQLGAYYPGGARYLFENSEAIQVTVDGKAIPSNELKSIESGKQITWSCRSSSSVAKDGSACKVTYRLKAGEQNIEVDVEVMDESGKPFEVTAYDAFRADRTFEFKAGSGYAICSDDFFRQAYAVVAKDASLTWSKDRLRKVNYEFGKDKSEGSRWSLQLLPGTSAFDLVQTIEEKETGNLAIKIADQTGGVSRALIEFRHQDNEKPLGSVRCDEQGLAQIRLATGSWIAEVSAVGYPKVTSELKVKAERSESTIQMPLPARVDLAATDGNGKAIPCKVTFYGINGTKNPDFAPDSASGAVGHCYYTASGNGTLPVNPGEYEVYVSYGPEYDAVQRKLTIKEGEASELHVNLKRSVNTKGWVSAELHSHSSPSGDNTTEQRGRVLNLLCEHLEFAPCTEHNRIDTYMPHLEALKAVHLMATCTGMELTGSDLPVNHQNAFPLHHHPHTQDGGGPQTDDHPEVQIERLAMWDNGAPKVVQSNHPDLRRIYRDLDKSGNPMPGLSKMLGFMDVVEVHPPAGLFAPPDANNNVGDPPNRIVRWMQLINLGHRIPGVVNTDAHYNVHGSGWLRNWFESSTDDPAKIDIKEMIHSAEHGHIVMSTGPFLEVTAESQHQGEEEKGGPGDNIIADKGEVELKIKVQCPNWFDIDRVQIFVNGRAVDELNFTRAADSDRFDSGTVKFDEEIRLTLDDDAHIIVATIGEKSTLGPVMGETSGKLQPVAVSNPIYVDIDGDGFTPNRDDLGVGLLDEKKKATKE